MKDVLDTTVTQESADIQRGDDKFDAFKTKMKTPTEVVEMSNVLLEKI